MTNEVVGHVPAPGVAVADAIVLVVRALRELFVVWLPVRASLLVSSPGVCWPVLLRLLGRPALLGLLGRPVLLRLLGLLRLLLPRSWQPLLLNRLLPELCRRLWLPPVVLRLLWPLLLLLPRVCLPPAVPGLRLPWLLLLLRPLLQLLDLMQAPLHGVVECLDLDVVLDHGGQRLAERLVRVAQLGLQVCRGPFFQVRHSCLHLLGQLVQVLLLFGEASLCFFLRPFQVLGHTRDYLFDLCVVEVEARLHLLHFCRQCVQRACMVCHCVGHPLQPTFVPFVGCMGFHNHPFEVLICRY